MKDTLKCCSDCGCKAHNEEDLVAFIKDARLSYGTRNLCKICHAERQLVRRYGITLAEYDTMLDSQQGRCAICGTTEPSNAGRFHVDHNHISGEVRGLLCSSCNMGIGKLQDSPIILRSALKYLETKGNYEGY